MGGWSGACRRSVTWAMTMSEVNIAPRGAWSRRLLALGLLLAAYSLYLGWGRWSDPQIDFGRELYVPWRLLQGDWLYRDIAYFNGPLSPYLNALWFKLFGTGYWTLVAANGVLLLAYCGLLWRLCRNALPQGQDGLAAAALLAFSACAFFFGQQSLAGNYNFLSPYSHEATHGLVLGSLAVYAAWGMGTRSSRWFGLGFLLGLVFLTKVELFGATLAGVGALVLCAEQRRNLLPKLPSLLAGLLLPVAIALLLLTRGMPLSEALEGLLGPWRNVFAGRAAELAFYQAILGFDHPLGNALAILRATGVLATLLLAGCCLARKLPQSQLLAGALFCSCFLAWRWLVAGEWAPEVWLARCLPLATLALFCFACFQRRPAGPERQSFALWRAWTLFGLLLLAKIILQPRFAHYGFFLTLPATAGLLLFALGWLPVRIGAPRMHLAAVLLAAYGAAGAGLLERSSLYFENQPLSLAEGPDRMRVDFRGQELAAALGVLEERLGPGDELLVLPEGIGLNYLLRIPTPTRFINFMPLELLLFGEGTILAELRKNPPALVLLLHKDTSEYGYPFFGTDYGREIMAWVKGHYRPIWSQSRGGETLHAGTLFGAELYALASP